MGLSTESYYQALAIAPKISGALSFFGSMFLIGDVIRRHRKNSKLRATHRAILVMSSADLTISFWTNFLSTWMVPRDDERAAFAAGNEATCVTQAFLYEFFIYVLIVANVTLAVTYWLTVCREKSEEELRKWYWKLILVGTPFILGLANSLPKLVLAGKSTTYNGYWWCELVAESKADDLLDQIILSSGFVIVLISMAALVRYVYVMEKRMGRFSITSNTSSNQNPHCRTLEVTYQGLMYIAVWFTIALPSVAVTVFDDRLPQGYVVFWSCLFPLHGLMNAVVYFRPKYLDIRKRGQGRISAVNELTNINLAPALVERMSGSMRRSFKKFESPQNVQTIADSSGCSEEITESKGDNNAVPV